MKRLLSLLMTAVLGVGLAVAIQTPAQASFYQCDALAVQICGWKDVNYNGAFRTFSNPNGVCTNLNADWNNVLSSVWNHRPLEEIRFYDGANCAVVATLIVNPNSGTQNLHTIGGGWGDKISSYKIVWD